MPTEREVYAAHADQYERLIQREDHQGNLLPAIRRIRPLDGLDALDLGAGTGRLARTLAPHVRSLRACDASAHMLGVAARALRGMGARDWAVAAADHRRLPLPPASADLALSGWSFSYLAVWGGARWRSALGEGLDEVRRVLRPGGTVLLIESLGTGTEVPRPPAHLQDYLAWLEEAGFESDWVRTDYRFESLAEAVELATFFFGEEMGRQVRLRRWTALPECTGLYWRRF